MKRRLLCLMPALVMALLTGCALAQPVRESAGADRWVGYYLVYVPQDVMDAGSDSDLRPQGIVWGEWDETTETITFPDLAGSALLMFGREDERITPKTYTVVKGDTLWDIAARFYGSGTKWGVIAEKNGVTNPRLLQIGTVLYL